MTLLLCLLAAAPPASSDDSEARRYIAAAAALYASLDDQRALEQLAAAKRLAHKADETVLISLYEGLILSDEGRRDEAEAAFRTAFSLDPDAPLPVKVSPRQSEWIDALREKARKALARAGPMFAPEAPPPEVRAPAPVSRAWIPAVAGLACLAGAGVSAGLEQSVEARLRSGDRTIQSGAQLQQLYDLGRTYTFAGEGLAVAGGVALVVGAVMWLVRPGEKSPVSVVPHGAGVAVAF